MKETETIVEMITRFTDIVNGLEALGKTYKESEKVMKILRSLPSKWHTKVTVIQEAKDLTKLPMFEDEKTSYQRLKSSFLNKLAMWVRVYINGSSFSLIDFLD